jgi:hypothetical protein
MKTNMAKNLCAKTMKREDAYEVWQNDRPFAIGGDVVEARQWTTYVLKKYQADDEKQYARAFCDVVTPFCPDGELGDVYVADYKRFSVRIK